MKNKNNKPLSVLVSSVLILVFSVVPSSFPQSIKNSTSLVQPSNILQEQEMNSTNNIHIMKTSANSYNLVNGQTVLVGTFDTTYAITGRSNSTVAQELSRAIASAHSLNFTIVAIKCDFGMSIENWQCEDHSIFN